MKLSEAKRILEENGATLDLMRSLRNTVAKYRRGELSGRPKCYEDRAAREAAETLETAMKGALYRCKALRGNIDVMSADHINGFMIVIDFYNISETHKVFLFKNNVKASYEDSDYDILLDDSPYPLAGYRSGNFKETIESMCDLIKDYDAVVFDRTAKPVGVKESRKADGALLRESCYYTISLPVVKINVGGRDYFANGVTATGELTAGCGSRGEDEFEIDPDSVVPDVSYWTVGDDEVGETSDMVAELCDVLAGLEGWEEPDSGEYHI